MAVNQKWVHSMTPEDKQFYRALGQRISQYRKDQGLTQVQLAEILGIAQQTMAHYEGGNLRVAVSLLRPLATTLGASFEELIEGSASAVKKKRGPASTLQRQIEQIGLMPRSKQRFISEMLEALIKQQQAS
ncbi:helix-turn-helix transcriptional regulator [uncultured Microbulbifer sp.]|uniref:helix-turn-helix domain-containing protein n=1 Tax=uncultured Microbulbifer sp. TaxID=348147 RepID=UPI002633A516|nr:helix-turn-helix transcriptional regulator [uncultured Microbulbifer sp.]